MHQSSKPWWKRRLESLRCAWRGILVLIKSEPNARIHVAATIVVCAAAAWYSLSLIEVSLLVLCVGLVWAAEAINTAIERLCDLVTKEENPTIRDAKDVAAGGVLLAATAAAIVAGLIFLPRIFSL